MFTQIERSLCEWFEASGFVTDIQDGEWMLYANEDAPLSITSMAKAVADDLARVHT